MHIIDLLKIESIELNAAPTDKKTAIELLGDLMEKSGNLTSKEDYLKAVFSREEAGTTGLGDGIATPHAKSSAVREAGLSAMVVPDGMDFDSLDGKPSRLFFMIAAPEGEADVHIQVLSKLATLIVDPDFRDALIAAATPEQFLALIDAKENDRFQPAADAASSVAGDAANGTEESKKASQGEALAAAGTAAAAEGTDSNTPTFAAAAGGYRILAVTACPTGIAHTFMAAETLERTARDMGISIKVEKNGSGGIQDPLTAADIQQAECIIVAADKNVEMARFAGKPLIRTKVANGIHKAGELLEQATSGTVPVYQPDGTSADTGLSTAAIGESEGIGRQIYKHLMNGVSHMLPFVIGGGILIALAFLFDTYNPAAPSKFGSGTPLSAFFMNIGGTSFGFMLPVLAGFIAQSIADRPGLAAGFVGGALANAGGSGFLGALLAGFAAGYLVLALKKAFSGLPHSLEGIKPVLIYPLLGVFLIGVAIIFVINPPVSAINNWLMDTLKTMGSTSRVLLGIIFGGMMAVDMGGPVNKAAYVIGTGALAEGEFGVMAAVMAGGMVPPLAIALCTTFFPNRFTKSEREAGLTNYIMGLSFITEGAIPFAAADPLRVLPACIVGASTAGALSMFFDCTLRAPHGGIFVVPTIGNPLMYLVSIAVGAVISMVILAVLKKPIQQ